MVATKQNAAFIQFDRLSSDDYATLAYILPFLIAPAGQVIYYFCSGELSWLHRSETGLIVHMAFIYAVHMALIRKFTSIIGMHTCAYMCAYIICSIYNVVVPGRILQIFAISKANLLRLKQIFVRYVSHEIR